MTEPTILHRSAQVLGRRVFWREAGDPTRQTIVLLHGFPASSFMFRDLIPRLAARFHVVAPDLIGFGQSESPAATEFEYSFANLARHLRGLLDHLGLTSCIYYMQDYGGPIGFRLFVERPEQVVGFVIQNTNAYLEGVGEMPRQVFLPLWERRDSATEAAARGFLAADTTRFQYLVGAGNPEAVSPDNWTLDQALLDRPGHDRAHLDLLVDYRSNVAAYPEWQAAFRAWRPRTLITWGRHDPFFIPAGAEAYRRDLPQARLVWLDGGHFVLDEHAGVVAAEILAEFG